MLIDTCTLPKDERTYLELGKLFEDNGYRLYKMRKFEEYSLYLENKNFLGSESVLTFQGFGGKLMALKPDVTLSIVKNVQIGESGCEKLYYRESVYRTERGGSDFKEINQMGLECIGNFDNATTIEICSLAVKSLATIDDEFVFAVSHMGFVSGLLDACGVNGPTAKKAVLECLRSRNAHDIAAAVVGSDENAVKKLAALASAGTNFEDALALAKSLADTEETVAAVNELSALCDELRSTPFFDRVRLDFSVLNDIDYYNGVIFQGYVRRVPKLILSGGRYDGLLARIGKDIKAMGFALSLGDLNAYYPRAGKEA